LTHNYNSDLTAVIPTLISLLSSPSFFIPASDALQDILTASALADGGGTKTLTEPLLDWISAVGKGIAENANTASVPNPISTSLCKLLCAIGDHSNNYLAKKLSLSSNRALSPAPGVPTQDGIDSRVQEFLRTMLLYTGFPGWYGINEEESEMTLGFWYLLQESLWEVGDATGDGEGDEWINSINAESGRALDDALKKFNTEGGRLDGGMVEDDEYTPATLLQVKEQKDDGMALARMLFGEVVGVLKRKVTWPTPAQMQASGAWDVGG
jgi:hypothetical protein